MTATSEFIEIRGAQTCPVCGHKNRCKLHREHHDDLAVCFRASEAGDGWRLLRENMTCSVLVRSGSAADKPDNDRWQRPRAKSSPSAAATPSTYHDAAASRYAAQITDEQVQELADKLGVTPDSLRAIGVGHDGQNYLFPERDHAGRVVGLNQRLAGGRKVCRKGDHRGLITPEDLGNRPDPVLVVEGPSDVAAALSMGLTAVGRPNDKGGADYLARLLKDREIIVTGENDEHEDGLWPGRDGAMAVAAKIGSDWALPPIEYKDVRSYLNDHRGDDHHQLGQQLLTHLQENRQKPAAQPTDTLPADPGPSWITVADVGKAGHYGSGIPPISTTYRDLDEILGGGFRPQCVYVLAGRTGGAKSTLAMNIARRAALAGVHALVLKLEETITEAVWRIHAAASQVPFRVLLDGASKHPEYRSALVDGWDLLRSLPLRFADCRELDAITRTCRHHADQGGQLVIVDQLSMVHVAGTPIGYETATAVSNAMRMIARECSLPILLLTQINRPAAKGKDHLSCNDLRDSGCIENDAAAVLLIDRIRGQDGPGDRHNPIRFIQLLVGKNRYGAVSDPEEPIELVWHPRIARIEDYTMGGQQ